MINWANPEQIPVFCNGRIYRSTTGGKTRESWPEFKDLGWQTMTQPLLGLPYTEPSEECAQSYRSELAGRRAGTRPAPTKIPSF